MRTFECLFGGFQKKSWFYAVASFHTIRQLKHVVEDDYFHLEEHVVVIHRDFTIQQHKYAVAVLFVREEVTVVAVDLFLVRNFFLFFCVFFWGIFFCLVFCQTIQHVLFAVQTD